MDSNPSIPPKIVSRAQGPPINRHYRINIHFQPDLPYQAKSTTTVIESLAETKEYHSQFRTGISNGGLIGRSGRMDWEDGLFGDFYSGSLRADTGREVNTTNTTTSETVATRPKYGALNINDNNGTNGTVSYGAAPRFGSCYFRLHPDILDRSSFCYPDSVYNPQHFGTAEHFDLDELARNTIVDDPLDGYIEAHVHGPLVIPGDMEALVLDPSYRGTFVEEAAMKLGCLVKWHAGYRCLAEELKRYKGYRGEEFVDIAIELAKGTEDGVLTPEVIGRAYRESEYSQQEIKKVWHYLACYGRLEG